MITLTRVEAVNFRGLGHIVLEPATDTGALTALTGANGTGKSSTVAAVLFALYGVAPEGVTVAGLKRQGTMPADECWVEVTFTHAGQQVQVLRAVKGARNSTIARITVDGTDVSVSSTKTANQWITRRLGLDAAGFLTAVAVRQKELEDLLRARPAERKKTVERLAGIERLSVALQTAREDETVLRKELASLGFPEEELAETTRQWNDANSALQAATAAAREADQQVQATTEAFTAATTHAQELADAHAAAQQAREAVQQARANVTSREAALQAAQEQHQQATQQVNGDSADAATAALERIESQITAAQSITHAHAAAQKAEKALTVAQQRHTAAREALDAAIAAASARTPEELQPLLAEATEHVGALQGEYQRLRKAIDVFEHTDDATCPTCSQHLPDPQHLRDTLTSELEQITADGKAARATVTELHEKLTAAQAANTAITLAQGNCDSAQQALDTANTAHTEAHAALHELLATFNGETPDMDTLTEQRAAAVANTQAWWRVGQTQVALDTAHSAHHDAVAALDAALAAVPEAGVDEAAHATAQANLTAARETLATARETLATANAQATVAQATFDALDARANDLQAAVEVKEHTARETERAAATREALEVFRSERLTRLTPELSDIASDLVARMTAGRYTSVWLDETFTPYVTDNTGQQRPFMWLSGGEEAVVALALRLAIGEVVSGGVGGLLVLDEVLTAQDGDRRAAMMSAISTLPGRQVIMVNHIAEAADLADVVYEFTPGEDEAGNPASFCHITSYERQSLDVVTFDEDFHDNANDAAEDPIGDRPAPSVV